MITVKAETKAFDKAMSDLIRKGGRDIEQETVRQAKLLALQIASSAPPYVRGAKGLANSIPRLKAASWMKVVKKLVKPAYSMRIIDALATPNPEAMIKGIAVTTKRDNLFRNNAVNRIVMSAKRDAGNAVRLLRILLRGWISNSYTMTTFENIQGDGMQAYYNLLDRMGKEGLKSIPMRDRVYVMENIKKQRQVIIDQYKPHIGHLKAGWVQAAVALPSKAGKKPPNWLLNKPKIGSGGLAVGGYSALCIFRNNKGNTKGINTRLDYVGKAVRLRTRKMINGLKAQLKATMAAKGKTPKAVRKDDSID